MLRKFIFSLILLITVFGVSGNTWAYEEDTGTLVEDQLDFYEIDEYVNQIDKEVQEHLPELSIRNFYEEIKSGNFKWNMKDILKGLLSYFFREVVANSGLLTKLLILAVASAVLSNLQSAFDNGNIAILGHGVIYLVLISIALNSFTISINTAKEAIDTMTGFLYALMPLLLSLLAAMGGVTSAALIHPAMIIMLGFVTMMIKTIIFPFIYFMAVLNIVGHIAPSFKVSRLAGLFKDLSVGFLGIVMTVFVGFLGMQGLAGSVADGLTVKAAKFATGAFIPVVGKSLADALDTVIGTSLILKNGIGILGVIVVFLLCAIPAVKIIAISLIYRIVAALVQPFGDYQLSEALHSLANTFLLVFAAVAAVGLMFFFIITVTIGTGNISMMFR
ncbi:MAG: stage III sporulation protein AE [Bacillota bacterium]|jgi:stage III sporulation protein AE|nr:stage III sporulation protein AE [Clostridia bacterium]